MYQDVKADGEAVAVRNIPTRDDYDAIECVPDSIKALVRQVREAAGWQVGITRKGMRYGGFESRNIDVYGYDEARNLAVIQLRRARKRKEGWYTAISKMYALVGTDVEQLFSHPLAVSPRRNRNLYSMTAQEVVRWAESKIFDVPMSKLNTIIRQGDIALVPVKAIPSLAQPAGDVQEDGTRKLVLRQSHVVTVDGSLCHYDDYYVDGLVEVVHNKGEHRAISGEGRFRVVLGERGDSPWWMDAAMGD